MDYKPACYENGGVRRVGCTHGKSRSRKGGVGMVWGGCSDMDVGVSILYAHVPATPEVGFPKGRGIYVRVRLRASARVNHPVRVRGKAVRV